jgi:ribosomal-protein-alanine N-acetyltransferase
METVKLRSAGIEDLREIVAVARPIAGVPCWSESVWANVLAADDHAKAVFVAERLKRMVGFVVVGCVAGVAEIESLAVAEDVLRQGIGQRLCRAGIEWSRDVGGSQIELEVRASNRAALCLYKAVGFAVQGTRRGYYKAPVEDAILMALALGGGEA